MLGKRSTWSARVALLAVGVMASTAVAAQAYVPTPRTVYQLPSNEPCLKGRGNCIIYPKSTELPSGRLVAAWEKATVVDYPAPDSIGGAVGGTMPIWKSDDQGTSWQPLSDVPPPSRLSNDPAVAKYSSNWTNPNLYVLPQRVGNLAQGSLLLATVVSGEDEFFRERKAADPNWQPSNDGDRRDMAIALYASTTSGASWTFVNIVTTGGWQGGSAGNIGGAISAANTTRQIDPVWEPHLEVIGGRLVAYYSDENDYTGYNPTTGVPTLAPDNQTGPDSGAQILAHRTWDGTSASWSAPVVDVTGDTFSFNGSQRIGGGRPGMTTLAPTTDGKYFMTFEYFGGGGVGRHKLATDPLRFFADNDPNGMENTSLPVTAGSRPVHNGGSPVLMRMPDGRIAYNADGNGNVWVNDGSSTGNWTEYRTTLGPGYSRNLQYVTTTGRVVILQATWGGPTTQPVIRHADVDLGRSAGTYYRITNRATNQVIGTSNNTTDADIGNGGNPDVRLEAPGSAANAATQYWHLTAKSGGGTTLLNKSGGRAASIWGRTAAAGARVGSWVDDLDSGQWTVEDTGSGFVRFRSTQTPTLYLTAGAAGAPLTLQTTQSGGTQEWRLDAETAAGAAVLLRNAGSGLCADVWGASTADQAEVNQYTCHGNPNQRWRVEPRGAGVQVVNVNSGKCLELYAFSTAPGARTSQWTCNGGTNQLWTQASAAGGTSTFRNVHSGLCLEVDGSSASNGAALVQRACTGAANQRWTPQS